VSYLILTEVDDKLHTVVIISKMFLLVSHLKVPGIVPFTDQREREGERENKRNSNV